jgi:hypothetical protein
MDEAIKKIAENYKHMYDLGYEHGYETAKRDIEIEQLKKELAEVQS